MSGRGRALAVVRRPLLYPRYAFISTILLHCSNIRRTIPFGLTQRPVDSARARQTLDLPHLFGALERARVERALSQEPVQGADRPLGRVRSAHPDRLRLRSRSLEGRGRQSRRADRPSRRHARAVRRHPGRRDEHLDDHQRHRAVAARALHRGRRRAGRAAREAAGHHAERHREGISVARDLRVSARAFHAAHQGRDRVHDQGVAEMESDERVLLPSAGSRRDAGAGARLRARHRDRDPRHREGLGRGRA